MGAFLFVAFFASLIFLAKQNSQKPAKLSSNGWVKGGGLSASEGARLRSDSGDSGGSTPKVTLIEFEDFQCPACKTYHPIVRDVLNSYDGKSFKLMFKHFPLTSAHKNAFAAAVAAEAAGAQGKFFEMHDLLYERQDEWAMLSAASAREKFIAYANGLKLNEGKFVKDLINKDLEEKIRANQNEGINNGVSGTPTFFLNGKLIQNPRTVDDFKKLIDEELKK